MIRSIQKGDLESCALLFMNTFNKEPWNESWSYEKAFTRLLNIFNTPDFSGFVRIIEDKIVGALFFNTTEWYTGKEITIKELFVDSTLQGYGIGKSLLTHFDQSLDSNEEISINLYTLRNEQTLGFYKKLGYEIDDDLCIMSKKV